MRCARWHVSAGFMGLAVSMLSDPGWRNILKEEDAESYMKVYRWGHGLGEVGWGGVEWGGMPIRT